MDIESVYQEVMGKLKNNQRPLLKLTPDNFAFYLETLQAYLKSTPLDLSNAHKVLLILGHGQSGDLRFEGPLLGLMSHPEATSSLIISALSASQIHLIKQAKLEGRRASFAYLEALKKLLYHADPEVVEWSLRTLDQLGGQGILLKEDLRKIRPGISAVFNQHKKNIQQIVDMLLKRFSPPS